MQIGNGIFISVHLSKINPPSTRLLTHKSVARVDLQLLTRESGQVIKSGASESDGEAERKHKSLTQSAARWHTTAASSVKQGPEA